MPWTRWLVGAAAVAALASAPACVPNDNIFFIVQNQVAMSAGVGAQCTLMPDPGGLANNHGVLDVALRRSYIMSPLYRSELMSSRDPVAGRAETRGLYVEGAEIELRLPAPGQPPESWVRVNLGGPSSTYTVASTTFVPPGTSAGPGYAVGPLEIIPTTIGDALARRVCILGDVPTGTGCMRPSIDPSTTLNIVAIVRPFGRTMGGLSIQGAAFNFPMTVCCACLVSFPAEANDPTATTHHNCFARTSPTTVPCTVGQDEAVDCRLCADNLLCQPPNFGCNP